MFILRAFESATIEERQRRILCNIPLGDGGGVKKSCEWIPISRDRNERFRALVHTSGENKRKWQVGVDEIASALAMAIPSVLSFFLVALIFFSPNWQVANFLLVYKL